MHRAVLLSLCSCYVFCAIRDNTLLNKLININPVGRGVAQSFVPLTELPPPQVKNVDGRRHLEEDCTKKPPGKDVIEGGRVEIFGDYYDDGVAKTMATVIIPDHIDYKHFQITTPIPYLTVGPIEGIGYHPSTPEHLNECEKIYQDHMEEMYSDETLDYSDESLEMAKMPIEPIPPAVQLALEEKLEEMYEEA